MANELNTNLYGEDVPLMKDSGTFWRCRHGHTLFNPCRKCGFFHPVRFFKHWWTIKSS